MEKYSTAMENNRTALEFALPQFLFKKRVMAGLAFVHATQSSIARYFELEFKAAPRGTVKSLTRLCWVCEEGKKWQNCTNGFVLPSLWFVKQLFVKIDKLE